LSLSTDERPIRSGSLKVGHGKVTPLQRTGNARAAAADSRIGKPDGTRVTLFVGLALCLIVGMVGALLVIGRVSICNFETIELWHGTINDSGNSQHMTDWYTPSHIIHGFLRYGATWLTGLVRGRPLPLGVALLIALGVECAWEIAENTNLVINRYRTTNAALNYYGDSVTNSVMGIGSMIAGFWVARLSPPWLTVIGGLLMELIVGFWIRDNLILNIIMLIYPVAAINQWQAAR
jgi:hypothetical protein